ncbi:MAG TPA: alpha/beta hydrolase domain-containing protein, partial [Microthrixaceae bacterium]|nr:alpha/beta hydrolase domain-containing protein [Microthrixaceae bacterium]
YGGLVHPGDAYAYDVFTQVVDSLLEDRPEPLDDLDIQRVVAVGESQSAYALVTYVNGVQPRSERFDGFLIHSRGRGALPLGDAGRGADVEGSRGDPPVLIRDDLDVPVLVLQTETDVLGFLDSLSCRQPDTGRFRCWEVAGAAHADLSLIGELETMLGCADPVNRGQQRFVVRSALRHLVDWAGTGTAPPSASPLAVAVDESGSTVRRRFETDELGNVLGGVRTPCVDAAVETLSGLCRDGESHVCQLFGRRLALPDAVLRDRYPTLASYREAYTAATDRAIDDGFILGDDRDEVLEDAPADVITW